MLVAVAVAVIVFAAVAVLLVFVYRAQLRLDIPDGGLLVVEKQEDGPVLVYFQAMKDPGTFTDGEQIRLKVRVMDIPQEKH